MNSRDPVSGASDGVPGTGDPVKGDPVKGDPGAGDPDEPRVPADPVGYVAVGLGFLGIVVFGIGLGVLAAILGGLAGQRARERGGSFELAYLALLLAVVDGVVWLVMQKLFQLPIVVG